MKLCFSVKSINSLNTINIICLIKISIKYNLHHSYEMIQSLFAYLIFNVLLFYALILFGILSFFFISKILPKKLPE